MKEKLEELAQISAAQDYKEGNHRTGANIAALLAALLTFNKDHQPCGKLTLERDARGYASGFTCPVHGTTSAPEWVERDKT